MEKDQLVAVLTELFPALEINASGESLRAKTDAESIRQLANVLRNDKRLLFDYLFNLYGVDREDRFSIIYGLESTLFQHTLVIETDLTNHDNPEIDTLSDIWKTAEFQEREVYDLMGVKFINHPDPRRLFLEDGWGFPLRKDYKDEINFIER